MHALDGSSTHTRATLVARWSRVTCQCRKYVLSPWVGRPPWRRKWQPTPVFLPGKSHGQGSLVGYSPWGLKRVRHDLVSKQQQHPYIIFITASIGNWENNGSQSECILKIFTYFNIKYFKVKFININSDLKLIVVNMLSKILVFIGKPKFCHWEQIMLSVFL